VRPADELCERQTTCAEVWHEIWSGTPFGSDANGEADFTGAIKLPGVKAFPSFPKQIALRAIALRKPAHARLCIWTSGGKKQRNYFPAPQPVRTEPLLKSAWDD